MPFRKTGFFACSIFTSISEYSCFSGQDLPPPRSGVFKDPSAKEVSLQPMRTRRFCSFRLRQLYSVAQWFCQEKIVKYRAFIGGKLLSHSIELFHREGTESACSHRLKGSCAEQCGSNYLLLRILGRSTLTATHNLTTPTLKVSTQSQSSARVRVSYSSTRTLRPCLIQVQVLQDQTRILT